MQKLATILKDQNDGSNITKSFIFTVQLNKFCYGSVINADGESNVQCITTVKALITDIYYTDDVTLLVWSILDQHLCLTFHDWT